jgi:hypothetical protein
MAGKAADMLHRIIPAAHQPRKFVRRLAPAAL